MIIEKIKLQGFMSYIDEEVDFRPYRTLLIAGSNGEGKSALLEAVPFCWWGVGRGKSLSDYINDQCLTLRVETIFLMDNSRYKKIRQYGKAGTINELYIDKVNEKLEDVKWRLISDDTKRKTDELLSNILGYDYNIFSNSVFLGQREESSFIEGDASDRKELFCNLLGSQIYEQAAEIAKESAKEADSKIQSKSIVLNDKVQLAEQVSTIKTNVSLTSAQIQTHTNTIKHLQEHLAKLQTKREQINLSISKQEQNKKQLVDVEQQIQLLKKQKQQLEKDEIEKSAAIETTIDEGIEAIEQLQKSIDSEQEYLDQKAKHQESLKAIAVEKAKMPAIKEKLTSHITSKETLIQKQTEINTNIRAITDKKKKIEKAGAICPITEETCDKLSDVNKKKTINELDAVISKYNSQLEQVQKDLTFTRESITELDGQLETIIKRTDRESTLTSKLATAISNLDQIKVAKEQMPKTKIKYRTKVDELTLSKELLDKRIASMKTEIDTVENKKAEIEKHIASDFATELVTVERQIKVINGDVFTETEGKTECSTKLGSLTSKLEQATLAAEDVKTIKTEIAELQDELRICTELSFSFGKNGIQKDIINDNVPLLEAKTNEFLSKFTGNTELQVKFDLDPVTKSGKLKKQGGLDVVIFQKGKPSRLLNMYSGGETVRIVFSILLSLSFLLTKRSGKRSQTLIIDERIAALDQEGIDQFIEIMRFIESDYKKVMLVSHITELKESFSSMINVRKDAKLGSKVFYN
jgi:exonuclease SbcC